MMPLVLLVDTVCRAISRIATVLVLASLLATLFMSAQGQALLAELVSLVRSWQP
jgi:hypothetical protein